VRLLNRLPLFLKERSSISPFPPASGDPVPRSLFPERFDVFPAVLISFWSDGLGSVSRFKILATLRRLSFLIFPSPSCRVCDGKAGPRGLWYGAPGNGFPLSAPLLSDAVCPGLLLSFFPIELVIVPRSVRSRPSPDQLFSSFTRSGSLFL